MPSAHAAVKHELLVRHLAAWTPTVLHGHRRVTYVEQPTGESAVAAARVFCEFADLLEGREVIMLLSSPAPVRRSQVAAVLAEHGSPQGLSVHPFRSRVPRALRDTNALDTPVFAWFDRAIDGETLAAVATDRNSQVLLATSQSPEAAVVALRRAGLGATARVELVDKNGRSQSLIFATAVAKALDQFKDELWSLDEYAGTRFRDPADDEATVLDISLAPNLAPLRRALQRRLAQGGAGGIKMADLRTWAVRETIYRAEDATRAIQALIAAGEINRQPRSGRLSPTTLLSPAESRDA